LDQGKRHCSTGPYCHSGNERLSTTYSIQREFTRAQWEDLADKLSVWQNNLENVRLSIEEVQNVELAA
jgi:hypothetical protein